MQSKLPALLAVGLLAAACSKAPGPQAAAGGPRQQAALTVTVTQPQMIEGLQSLDTAGGLYAWQEVAVGAEVSGYRVSEVLVDVGASVAKGAVLAKLDDTLLRESLTQAEASLAMARASAEQAQSTAKRGNTLQQTGVISKQDVEQLNTAATTAAAQLKSAESQWQAARQRLEYTVIRAPDAGVISARTIVPGQIANAGTTLFNLIRQSRVEWRAEVAANDIGRVRPGMAATIVRADGGTAAGKVRTVSPGVDANTQRGIAYIDLKLEPLVRPGMYVNGSIHLGQAPTLTVPLQAVTVRDGFSYVFVADYSNTLRQQRVSVGRLLGDKVEIREGIATSDRIVASGVGFLRDGDTVRIADGAAQSVDKSANKSGNKPGAAR